LPSHGQHLLGDPPAGVSPYAVIEPQIGQDARGTDGHFNQAVAASGRGGQAREPLRQGAGFDLVSTVGGIDVFCSIDGQFATTAPESPCSPRPSTTAAPSSPSAPSATRHSTKTGCAGQPRRSWEADNDPITAMPV